MILDLNPVAGYPEPYGTLLATLSRQTSSWQHQLEEPAPEEIVWQPAPGKHSIGGLMLHLAEVETHWIETVCCGREMTEAQRDTFLSAHTDPFEGIWPTPPSEPLSYYYAILNDVRSRTLQRVRYFGDPTETRECEWATVTLRWVLAHLIWHESYHGGQMVLLRELRRNLREE